MNELRDLLKSDPCYEQHIVSIKNLYEEYLLSVLTPIIYEGFMSMYRRSIDLEKNYELASKQNPNVRNIGINGIFQKILRDVPNLNVHKIKRETERIRTASRISDIFDDLVKATIKANIILLTYNHDKKRHDLVDCKYHESIIIHDFLHSCYIEASAVFYRNPELFCHDFDSTTLNKNKAKCMQTIQTAIRSSILSALPMKEILLEYLTKYEQKEPVFARQPKQIESLLEHSEMNEFEDGIPEVNPTNDHLTKIVDVKLSDGEEQKYQLPNVSPTKTLDVAPPTKPPDVPFSKQDDVVTHEQENVPNDTNAKKQPVQMINISPILNARGLGATLFKQMLPTTVNNIDNTIANIDDVLNP